MKLFFHVTEKFEVSSTQGQGHKHHLIKVSSAGEVSLFISTNNENSTVKVWLCYTSELLFCYFCCKCTHSSCFWCCCYINSILREAKMDKKWWEYFFFTNELPSPHWNTPFSNIFCSDLPFLFQIYFLPQKSSITVAQLLVSHPSSKNPKIDISVKSSILNNELVFSRYFITCSQVSCSLKWRNKEDAWFWNRHHRELNLLCSWA